MNVTSLMNDLRAQQTELRTIWRDVLNEEQATWLQALRTLIAMLLALAIAFRLDLSSPSSAAVTVAVISLPQSGMVLEKSFYRLLATLFGGVVTLILVGIFAQQRDLFILALALWVGTCAALSTRFRNFQSYGWALAGYTAAMIGFPAYEHTGHAFDIVVDRVSIVALGITCGGIVNATLFPQSSAVSLLQSVRRSFRDFTAFVQTTLHGYASPRALQATQRQFLHDIVALESARASSYFEDADSRIRTPRLRRFISQFMVASTTAHAINRLRENLLARGMSDVVAALEPLHTAFLRALQSQHQQAPTMAAEAVIVVSQLDELLSHWDEHNAAARARLSATAVREKQIELESCLSILRDFIEEARDFAETYAELRTQRSLLDRLNSPAPTRVRVDNITTAIAGARAACAMIAVCVFWIASDWPDGFSAALLSAVACTLFANVPAPTQALKQMVQGFLLGFIAGLICFTLVLPALDGLLLMVAGLLPFLMVGTYLMAQPRTAGMGSGYCIMFLVSLGITATMQYDIVALLNGGLAMLIGVITAAVAFTILFPTNTNWHARRIEKTAWRELQLARHAPLHDLRHRFESGVRDLSLQLMNLASSDGERQQRLIASMVLLEAGRAIIALRSLQATPFSTSLTAVIDDALNAFTIEPSAKSLSLLAALEQKIKRLCGDVEATMLTPPVSELVTLRTALQLLLLALSERMTQLSSRDEATDTDEVDNA